MTERERNMIEQERNMAEQIKEFLDKGIPKADKDLGCNCGSGVATKV